MRITMEQEKQENGYDCWLRYAPVEETRACDYRMRCGAVYCLGNSPVLRSAERELRAAIASMLGQEPDTEASGSGVLLGVLGEAPELDSLLAGYRAADVREDGYLIRTVRQGETSRIVLGGGSDRGVLYAAFHLLRLMQSGEPLDALDLVENPGNGLRMINHWDNMDGSIERGYAGKSIFFKDNEFIGDTDRLRDYARLLASAGLNAVAINNVNVHHAESKLITDYLPSVASAADIFRAYGIRLYLSVNFAGPIEIGGLATADPLDEGVRRWWSEKAADIYRTIPDFGGFLVKADSEFRPGPFTYGRNHADGANMLGEALAPYGGAVIWRCFVYNCLQDWRDRTTDRARAAYDHFVPLDGEFRDNVILQIKNGPMDFQVREPVSPLFGGLTRTNQMLELQITQEYTGQQKHLCYLVPQWKEVLGFDTHARGKGTTVAQIASGTAFGRPYGGIAAVSNIGDDPNWTGHVLAQANLYGFGRLAWNPELTAEEITREWTAMTFGTDPGLMSAVSAILLDSWAIYESYTAPLGIGWMVSPGHHYGPNVDGYEYSKWGTYHFADYRGIGVDRTVRSGTGYAAQYHNPHAELYESSERCPDELLLFFHHVPYTHKLKSEKTVIQHIYDSHIEGAEQAEGLAERWTALEGKIDAGRFAQVLERLKNQAEHAKEWRDVINTYFLRKSGIPDEKSRLIY